MASHSDAQVHVECKEELIASTRAKARAREPQAPQQTPLVGRDIVHEQPDSIVTATQEALAHPTMARAKPAPERGRPTIQHTTAMDEARTTTVTEGGDGTTSRGHCVHCGDSLGSSESYTLRSGDQIHSACWSAWHGAHPGEDTGIMF
mmetsp:Transcript_19044/g.45602  ORF Transcript_19044/g.45602 Transcript_19044/m.45602 type:complete len:148 (-) Transcript_19044:25-468(-)